MTIFGLDISHHQGTAPDLAAARREGIEFVIIKATQGATIADTRFRANLAEARAAGMLVAAYHYVTAEDSIQSQVDNVRRVVSPDVPVIPDVEAGSGTIPRVKTLVGLLRTAGYSVPLSYIPRWYWQQLGSPDLRGLPPLWSSRYPDTTVDTLANEWADVPASYWIGYGGLAVAVLQFSSSARVAGYAPLDANAYRGTRQQLAQLLSGANVTEDHMRDLILANELDAAGKPTGKIWVGDGMTRRHVADQGELSGLQFWIEKKGGDKTIQNIADLRVLGAETAQTPTVNLDYDRFVNDVIAGLAAKLELGFIPVTQLPE